MDEQQKPKNSIQQLAEVLDRISISTGLLVLLAILIILVVTK